MADPYETLGVPKDASQDDIRAAYRRLAKKCHPDLNPGNAKAEDRFKTLSVANELLSDPAKREQFDRGEIDGSGQPAARQPNYRSYADGDSGRRYGGEDGAAGGWSPDDLESMFGSMFNRGGAAGGKRPRPGEDRHYGLTASFLDAVNGATRRLTLPDGRTLDVKIPPGTVSGQILRLRGQGGTGRNGGAEGDALIEISVESHPHFTRDGQDITLEVPVALSDAVLGASIEVMTPKGSVRLRVPPHSESGTLLRLRDRGVPAHGGIKAGDLLVRLRVMLGPVDPDLEKFLRDRVALKHAEQPVEQEETP